MKKGDWTLLSNHGRILYYLASHPKSTIQTIALETGLSTGAVQKIISTLENDRYITRCKDGRSNRYIVHTDMPMRHRLERSRTVGDLIAAVLDSSTQARKQLPIPSVSAVPDFCAVRQSEPSFATGSSAVEVGPTE
jgi:hypothetical protein